MGNGWRFEFASSTNEDIVYVGSFQYRISLAALSKLMIKTAIITGGSRGIGRAIVDRFLSDKWHVVSCSRSECPNDLKGKVVWVQADVSSASDTAKIVSCAMDNFGAIDALVNNAGVQVEKTLEDSSDEDWDQVIGVNCRGVFNMSRAVLKQISHGGSIINIGSISGHVSDPSMALYNASKAFVHGLTRSIAVDHGAKVRCNAICPGWTMTEMAEDGFALAGDPGAAMQDALARHPVGRFGQPRDIANMAAWLVSDQAQYVSGQMFTVDGGLTAASPISPGLF